MRSDSRHELVFGILAASVVARPGGHLAASEAPAAGTRPAHTRPTGQLYYNLDCTDVFWSCPIGPDKAGEVIDRYVDEVAGAGVTTFLCNTNARRTNYRSSVWDAFWDGYDPAGPDDQPFLRPVPRPETAGYRKGIGAMRAVHDQGIDYPARIISRCRHHGISPWISLRMNDCHCNDVPDHPFHGSFWKNYPQFRRKNCSGYFATCLDYASEEVRAYYMALVVETLERYDVDGLELDFMREPFLFSAGKEVEGMPILTAWLRDVRRQVDRAAARRNHGIRLGVRVPSRPQVALAMGLDAIGWARERLINLLVATPRWETLEFDVPIARWRELLGGSGVTLAGGLEILYRPFPARQPVNVTPELAHGAAVSVLSQPADAVYLFNYFPINFARPVYQPTLRAMGSLDSLTRLPRTFAVTYHDITAPGEAYRPPLPATGTTLTFAMRLGPRPDEHWIGEVAIEVAAAQPPAPAFSVFVDDARAEYRRHVPAGDGGTLITWRFRPLDMAATDVHHVRCLSGDGKAMTVQRVELSFAPEAP